MTVLLKVIVPKYLKSSGHSTTKAALVYLHSSSERQQAIADAVSKQTKAALRQAKSTKGEGVKAMTDQGGDSEPSGTKVARRRRKAS